MKYGYVVGPCVAAAAGLAIGAIAMYVFDPDSGKRRRAAARDKTVSTVNGAVEGVQSAARAVSRYHPRHHPHPIVLVYPRHVLRA